MLSAPMSSRLGAVLVTGPRHRPPADCRLHASGRRHSASSNVSLCIHIIYFLLLLLFFLLSDVVEYFVTFGHLDSRLPPSFVVVSPSLSLDWSLNLQVICHFVAHHRQICRWSTREWDASEESEDSEIDVGG